MIDWFEFINRYYGYGVYTKADVAKYVTLKKITPEQYQQITGEPYSTTP